MCTLSPTRKVFTAFSPAAVLINVPDVKQAAPVPVQLCCALSVVAKNPIGWRSRKMVGFCRTTGGMHRHRSGIAIFIRI